MIHLVAVRSPFALTNIEASLRAASNGFYRLNEGFYLVVTNQTATALRDWVAALGASQTTVLRLEGGWGTNNNNTLAQWLQNAGPFF